MRKQSIKAVFENNEMEVALEALGKSIARWTDKGDQREAGVPGLSLHRRGRFAPSMERQARNSRRGLVAFIGPSGNALPQGIERDFHIIILNNRFFSLLSHSWPPDHILPDFTSLYNIYRRIRTIRQEMSRIGLPTFVLSGVGYDRQQGANSKHLTRTNRKSCLAQSRKARKENQQL